VQFRGGCVCVSSLDGDKPRACRSSGIVGSAGAATTASGDSDSPGPTGPSGRKFFPRARLPAAAKIFHVDRAFDSQAGAGNSLRLAHVTASNGGSYLASEDAAAPEQLAQQASSPAIPLH